MPLRPCLGCGRPTGDTRCPACTRARDHARGTRQQRGYDRQYELAREQALATATHCTTCGAAFTEDNPATGGHVVAIRNGGTASDGVKAECRRCNYGWLRSGS
jgi:hypothetical protein